MNNDTAELSAIAPYTAIGLSIALPRETATRTSSRPLGSSRALTVFVHERGRKEAR
ncbi:hypothetical protein [Streptomyces gelaticus]|uniref:hypothetical protein n=1 Tax=Streptomyces gelaticus TaxID=285446 RepID=UPI00167654B9|nr:hypothetical protein [Streptomyces gelaticus]